MFFVYMVLIACTVWIEEFESMQMYAGILVCVCMYICVCMYVYVYIYIYIYMTLSIFISSPSHNQLDH